MKGADVWYALGALLAGVVAYFFGGKKRRLAEPGNSTPPPAGPVLDAPEPIQDEGPDVVYDDEAKVAGDQPGRWFSWKELDRFDEAPLPVRENLRRLVRDVLDPLRDEAGRPVRLTLNGGYNGPAMDDWYRKAGRTLRGPGSYHRKGLAADIVVSGMRPADVVELLRAMREEGKVSFGPAVAYEAEGFTHVDLGPERSW